MPGIYSKPPRRAEFASDIRCLVKAATNRLNCEGEWETYVHTLADEIGAERSKARQEALAECNMVNGLPELDDPAAQRRKLQQLVARKEVEVAEVFFECGIHGFFCKVLEKANESMNPALFERLLGVSLLCCCREQLRPHAQRVCMRIKSHAVEPSYVVQFYVLR